MGTSDDQWKLIYRIGAITTVAVLCGIVLDMITGFVTSGNLTALPQTAVERFIQFRDNPLLGLYNLDLLNIINQLILIPSVFALYAAHRNKNNATALLSLILFLTGTIIFVAGNTSLTMLDLSHKYFSSATEEQKLLFSAAGEAMLAKGSHGSFSVFIGFALPTFANILMSVVMLKGGVFSRISSYCGIAGSSLMLLYIMMVTFIPVVEKMALLFAMPGGLLVMAWMIMFTTRLFRLSKNETI